MKKALSLFVATLLCSGMSAQIVSSRSVGIKTEQSRPTETVWYLRAGLNIMNLTGDGADGTDSKMGYNAMVGYQKSLGTAGAYWGMEAGLSSRGYKADELKCMAHNIQLSPFTFGWKFGLTDNFKIDAHLGAFLSYDYTSKMKEDGGSCSWGDFADENEIDYNHFDAGIGVGAGVWYDRFNLDFTYQHGFVDVFSDLDGNKASSFMIRLGIAF